MAPTPDTEPLVPRWGWTGWLLVAASFLVGFANFPLQVVGRDLEYLPGDVIDNRLNLYVLEHGYRYLIGEEKHFRGGNLPQVPPSRFWDMPIYYPTRGVTAWSDAHIGMLPLYSALRGCGLPAERAFQGWFLIPFVFNFAAAVWAARRLGLGPVGSAVTAYVFSYGLPLAAQVGHAQLNPRFMVPLAMAFAWEWAWNPRSSWRLGVAAFCVLYQTFISVYTGYFLVLLLATGGIIAAIALRGRLPWREIIRPDWRTWAARALVAIAVVAALFPLIDAHRRNGSEVPKEHVRLFAPRPLAWITPPGMASMFPELAEYTRLGSAMQGAGEEQLLPGFLPLVGIAVGLPVFLFVILRGKGCRDATSVMGICATATLLLGLLVTKFGTEDPIWCYQPLLFLPGTAGIRAISRVVLVLLFPAGFATGWIFDRLACGTGRCRQWRMIVVGSVAIALTAADQRLTSVTGERKQDWWWTRNTSSRAVQRRERIAEVIREHPNAKLVYLFPSLADALGEGGWPALQLDAMRAAQDFGLPTVNGWSGRSPKEWCFPPDWVPPKTYRALLEWLTRANETPPDILSGLLVIGEPVQDPDPTYDRMMREKYPPAQLK